LVLAGVQEQLQPLTARLFPRRVWLALEDDAVTVLTTRGHGEPVQLGLLRRVPLPRGACSAGDPLQVMALGDLIGDLLVELGLVGAEVLAVLPAAACSWRVVEWPFDDWPESADEALRQIDPPLGLPYDLSQAYVGLMPLEGAGQQASGHCSSLLVTVPRQRVLSWIEVFDIAGVELERLEAPQVCELRALASLLEGGDPGLLEALLVVDERGGRLTLLRRGVPEYERQWTGAMAEDEVERCIAYWRGLDPAVNGVRLWLAGSSSDLPLLAGTLSQGREWPIEILDPVAMGWMTMPPDSGDEGSLPGWSLTSLYGLMRAELAR
jgi:Tfp pilus assembly PilM family ATPase